MADPALEWSRDDYQTARRRHPSQRAGARPLPPARVTHAAAIALCNLGYGYRVSGGPARALAGALDSLRELGSRADEADALVRPAAVHRRRREGGAHGIHGSPLPDEEDRLPPG
jgi:hypothetical protein